MAQDLAIVRAGLNLAGRLHRPDRAPRAAVVIAHGLYSSMQSEKLTRLAQALAQAGHAALQFDAMGCGASPGDVRRTTLTSRRDEVLAAAGVLGEMFPSAPLVLLGSSLGGTASILAARELMPACLVCWSAPVDMAGLLERMAARPQPPELPDMAVDMTRHDLPGALAGIRGALFVHGERDEVAPAEQARLGHDLAGEPKDLLLLPGADHRLSRLADQNQAAARTLTWISRLAGWQDMGA